MKKMLDPRIPKEAEEAMRRLKRNAANLPRPLPGADKTRLVEVRRDAVLVEIYPMLARDVEDIVELAAQLLTYADRIITDDEEVLSLLQTPARVETVAQNRGAPVLSTASLSEALAWLGLESSTESRPPTEPEGPSRDWRRCGHGRSRTDLPDPDHASA